MRSNLTDAARRSQAGISRATVRQVDDDHNWQEADVDVHHSETHTGIERIHHYGFTAVPVKQDQQQQQQGQSQSSANDGQFNENQPRGPSAEAIITYVNGSRSHPVCIGIDDRRFRPYKLREGESYQYDQYGQGTLIRNEATYIVTNDDQQPQQQQGSGGGGAGGQSVEARDGSSGGGGGQQQQKYKRFVSLRHVNKKKQDRKGNLPVPAPKNGLVGRSSFAKGCCGNEEAR